MSLRVVDISSHQGDNGINPANLDCDAVIIKVSGGNFYVNDYWRQHAIKAIGSGKQVGFYHYAMENGVYSTPAEEAHHFLNQLGDYAKLGILALDFEADAQRLDVSWAKEWLDIVAYETGSTPWFYAYASYLNSRDHSLISGYPLWMASYLNKYVDGGWVDNPDNIWPISSWDHMTAYQYASTGHIGGYDGNLDLSVFYGGVEDWLAFTNSYDRVSEMVDFAVSIANDNSHGYSQRQRWNPDFDCASLMYASADHAGFPVGAGPDKVRYTGTMLADFTAAGFRAIPFEQVGLDGLMLGDILLNEVHHTEMYIGNGEFVGAHSSETGGIDGQPGDQTGDEISVVPAYIYSAGWDWVLRPPAGKQYIGDDDMSMECVFQPDDKSYMVYYDGHECHPAAMPHEIEAVNMVYRATHNGREIPTFKLGDSGSPWAMRFMDIVSRKME